MRLKLIPGALLLASLCQGEEALSLPELLKANDGKVIATAKAWRDVRRPEVLELFRRHIYGRAPVGRPKDLKFETVGIDKDAMRGAATRKQVRIGFSGPGGKGAINLLLFVPRKITGPVPTYLLLCHPTPMRTKALDPDRKAKLSFWPAEEIIRRGYAAAAFNAGDVAPDKHDGFKSGVYKIYDRGDRSDDAWGTNVAWAWGASRVVDYLVTDGDIDKDRIAVVGHSRGGRASFWAGVVDERIALTVSNESGVAASALARPRKKQRSMHVNKHFPHWFCAAFKQFDGLEDNLPVDQHMLVALIAPRLLYVGTAEKDKYEDAHSAFLSCKYAEPVFRLHGIKGIGTQTMPMPDHPVHIGHVGYHVRSGKHDMTLYDWTCFMDFSDKHWRRAVKPE